MLDTEKAMRQINWVLRIGTEVEMRISKFSTLRSSVSAQELDPSLYCLDYLPALQAAIPAINYFYFLTLMGRLFSYPLNMPVTTLLLNQALSAKYRYGLTGKEFNAKFNESAAAIELQQRVDSDWLSQEIRFREAIRGY
jgi:hypothetical protein